MFVGRRRELSLLGAELERSRASLIVAYGRRRVGKSRLIREAAAERVHVYFQATRVSSDLNLEQFKSTIASTLSASGVLEGITTWEGVFHYLAEYAEFTAPGLVVTLDEFPYITDNDQTLPSILQRFWDTGAAERGHLKLILCGSSIGHMQSLLMERNPLYGRKTMSLEVRQLPLRDAASFFEGWSAEDIVTAYSIFGGVPYYLQACEPQEDIHANVKNLLMAETGRLFDEPNVIVQNELRDARVYSSIMAALSEGCVTSSKIADRLKMKTPDLSAYLSNLQVLRLIDRERSLDTDNRAGNFRYQLNDGLIAFWHHFVRPNLSAISSGFGETVYEDIVRARLPEFMGNAFESICRDHVRFHLQEILGSPAQMVGHIWGHADYDIDVAGRSLAGRYFYGECKWRADPLSMSIVETLRSRAARTEYGKDDEDRSYLLFSRSGFTPDVLRLAQRDATVHPLDLATLVRKPVLPFEPEGPAREQVFGR